jgi:hypothetical protein
MSADHMLIHQASELLKYIDEASEEILPEEIVSIVKFHARGAAASALASGFVPGVGETIALGICAGFIWTMYIRINDKVGLPLEKNVLRTLASGVATNIAGNVVIYAVLGTALSFIPGIGSVGSSVIAGATCYAVCLTAGYVYLRVLTTLCEKGVTTSELTSNELHDVVQKETSSHESLELLKKAQGEFHDLHKQGVFSESSKGT